MNEPRLFILQRLSAALLATLVAVHLVVIIAASHGGLSAAEILGRTRSSFAWPALYILFVLAAATHAAIGLRAIVRETLGWRRRILDNFGLIVWITLVILGLRAVARIA